VIRREALSKQEAVPQAIKVGNLEINFTRHQVSSGGHILALSPKEYELLAFLMRNQGQVFTRDHLLERIWGYDYAGDTRTVDVHIRWLRQKIEDDPSHPVHLLAVWGVGYKFEG
jgi:DNA-binding response OmpR family regulator